MENMLPCVGSPPAYSGPPHTVPPKHHANVFISTFFLGNTSLNVGGYYPYPTLPPITYTESNTHNHPPPEGKSSPTKLYHDGSGPDFLSGDPKYHLRLFEPAKTLEASLIDQIRRTHLHGEHKRTMEMMASECFSLKHHQTLRDLWLSAVYGLVEPSLCKSPQYSRQVPAKFETPLPFHRVGWGADTVLPRTERFRSVVGVLLEEQVHHTPQGERFV